MPPFQEIVFKDTRSSKIVAYSSAGWLLVHREKGEGKEVTEGDSCVENEKMASTRFRQFVAVCRPTKPNHPNWFDSDLFPSAFPTPCPEQEAWY